MNTTQNLSSTAKEASKKKDKVQTQEEAYNECNLTDIEKKDEEVELDESDILEDEEGGAAASSGGGGASTSGGAATPAFTTPTIGVERVIAGVVVGLATEPASPLALTTLTVVTVPAGGATQEPSALRKLVVPPPLPGTTP
jgi:hypothetical protein